MSMVLGSQRQGYDDDDDNLIPSNGDCWGVCSEKCFPLFMGQDLSVSNINICVPLLILWTTHLRRPLQLSIITSSRPLSLSLFPKTKEQLTNNTHSPTPHYSLANSLSLSWAPPAVNSCSLPCVYPFLSGRTTTSESELKFRPRWIFLNRSSSFWQPFCLFNKSRSDPCFVRIGLVGGSVDWMDGLLLFFYAIQLMAFPLSPAFSWLSAAVIPLMELHLLS